MADENKNSSIDVLQRVPLILFSGGLDSSYSLLSALETSDVDILSVSSMHVHNLKCDAEKKAREAILKKITALNKKKIIKHTVRTILDRNVNLPTPFEGGRGGLYQPELWLSAAASVINPEKHSKVILSYVKGDCAIAKLEAIKHMWYGLNALHEDSDWDGKCVPLSFPLTTMGKEHILDYLEMFDGSWLPKLTWTCEFPVKKKQRIIPCGKCETCKALAVAKIKQAIGRDQVTVDELYSWLASHQKEVPNLKLKD